MKKVLISLFAICTVFVVSVQSQTPVPQTPPRVLRIVREEIKAGMGASHAKVEAGWPRAFAKAKFPVYYIAMTSMSGPSEAWFVEPNDSFDAIEKGQQEVDKDPVLKSEIDRLTEQDGPMLSGWRNIIATYNGELSRPRLDPIGQMRYFSVTTYRVRPGHNPDFTEFRKIIKTAHEAAKTGAYFAVYQVASGAPAGTYLIFRPLKALKELDTNPTMGKAYQDALGADNQKKLNDLASAMLLGSESILYAFSPGMSYVSKEFIGEEAAFWHPKPQPAVKKEGKKVAGTQ